MGLKNLIILLCLCAYLKGEGRVVSSNLESGGVLTNEIERFVQNTGLMAGDREESLLQR